MDAHATHDADNVQITHCPCCPNADGDAAAGISDKRDANVIANLEPGNVVRAKKLKQLYFSEAGLRKDRTARRRIKYLVKDGPFQEITGTRQRSWVYLGAAYTDEAAITDLIDAEIAREETRFSIIGAYNARLDEIRGGDE